MDTADIANKEQRFRIIYLNTFDKLHRIFLKSLRNEELTQDILQEAYMKLWSKLDELDGRQEHFPFLYFHARNHARKEISRRLRQELLGQKLLEKQGMEDLVAEYEKKEYRSALNSIVEKLPVRRRQVYQMFREEGLSYKSIAEILNISVKTVDNHLSQATKTIKRELKSCYGRLRCLSAFITNII